MQNPVNDIKYVLYDLVSSETPDAQQAAVYRHYTPNAGFRNPFVRVDPSPSSREHILEIWQWYRMLSPTACIVVENVVYDAPRNILLVDVTQQFHLFCSPLKSACSRALTRLTLTEDQGLYFIALQEDFYEPEGIAAMIGQPLDSLTEFTSRTFATFSRLLAKSFQLLNYWRPKKTGIEVREEFTNQGAGRRPEPIRSSKNKKHNRPRGKTPPYPDLSNVRQLKLAEQGPSKDMSMDKFNMSNSNIAAL